MRRSSNDNHSGNYRIVSRNFVIPFVLITFLFFLWGYARSVLDVLNKHFQDFLSISVSDSTLIQASTYIAYALMALPAGILISKKGYRTGVVTGLIFFGIGAILFIPGAALMKFPIFLLALFIIGCGLAILETSANPYSAELGPKETSASRLNLSQAFNGLGCILGPLTIGGFLFSETKGNVALPYTIMGITVLCLALFFSRVKLPEIHSEYDNGESQKNIKIRIAIKALFKERNFKWGLIALFFYEIAEISINSLFINYVISDGWLTPLEATQVLSFGALGLFMCARVAGSAIMSKVSARTVLKICSILTVAGACLVTLNLGALSHTGIFICYAFEAIMFPTIFAMTININPKYSKIASSFLMMTPLGGAVGSYLMGLTAHHFDISSYFIVPAIAYLIVCFYAFTRKS